MEKVIKDSSENQVSELKDRVAKDGHELSYVNESHSELESLCTKKVSLYLRNPSENQIAELKDRVAKDGYELSKVCEFIDKDESNCSLESLCKKVKEGGIDIIYIYCKEHLSENCAKQIDLLAEFWHAKVEVIFVKDRKVNLAEYYTRMLNMTRDFLEEVGVCHECCQKIDSKLNV